MGLHMRQHVVWRLTGREPALVRDPRHLCSDTGRDLANLWQRWVQAALLKVRITYEVRKRERSTHEHLVGDAPRAARNHAEPNAWEDVGVIPLARHEDPAVELHRLKRA